MKQYVIRTYTETHDPVWIMSTNRTNVFRPMTLKEAIDAFSYLLEQRPRSMYGLIAQLNECSQTTEYSYAKYN